MNSSLVTLKSVLGFCQSWISPFPGEIKTITRTRVICDIQGELYHQNLNSAGEVDDVEIEILIEAKWIHQSVLRPANEEITTEKNKTELSKLFPILTTVLLLIIIIFVVLIIWILLAFCKYRKSLATTKVDDITNSNSKNSEKRKSDIKRVPERTIMPIPPARNHTVLGISDAQI